MTEYLGIFGAFGWLISILSSFSSALILVLRKVGLLDRLSVHFRAGSFGRKLLDCFYCLGFWISVLAWTVFQLVEGKFIPSGYFCAFCAAPIINYVTTTLLLYEVDQTQQRGRD